MSDQGVRGVSGEGEKPSIADLEYMLKDPSHRKTPEHVGNCVGCNASVDAAEVASQDMHEVNGEILCNACWANTKAHMARCNHVWELGADDSTCSDCGLVRAFTGGAINADGSTAL